MILINAPLNAFQLRSSGFLRESSFAKFQPNNRISVHLLQLFLWLGIMLLINVSLFGASYALKPSDQIKADLKQSVEHYKQKDRVLDMDEVQHSMGVWKIPFHTMEEFELFFIFVVSDSSWVRYLTDISYLHAIDLHQLKLN